MVTVAGPVSPGRWRQAGIPFVSPGLSTEGRGRRPVARAAATVVRIAAGLECQGCPAGWHWRDQAACSGTALENRRGLGSPAAPPARKLRTQSLLLAVTIEAGRRTMSTVVAGPAAPTGQGGFIPPSIVLYDIGDASSRYEPPLSCGNDTPSTTEHPPSTQPPFGDHKG